MTIEATEHKDRQVLSKIIEAPRYACSLAGALTSVHAIHQAIPVVHSAMGCNYNLYLGYQVAGAHQGSGYAAGTNTPCTRLGPKEVIFSGEDKLRVMIRNAMEIMDADFFMVLTGCAGSLIGDDIGSIARDFRNSPVPVFYADTGGYKGNTYRGYELVLEAMLDQCMQKSPKVEKGLVNILGVIPVQDVFWRGNLKEIQRLLEKLGLKVNVLFGHKKQKYGLYGLEAFKAAPSAELNIVLSPWVGVSIAKQLEERFDTPYLAFPGLPIGAVESANFLRQVGERIGIPKSQLEEVIADEDEEYYYYLEMMGDLYIDYGMQFDFVMIGDSNYVIGITKFLTNEVGCVPFTAAITDDPPDEYRATITNELSRLDYDLKPEVIFESNSGQIWDRLQKSEANLVLGSLLDKPLARSLSAAFLEVGHPIMDRAILNNPYCGYKGALELLGDIYTAVLQTSY